MSRSAFQLFGACALLLGGVSVGLSGDVPEQGYSVPTCATADARSEAAARYLRGILRDTSENARSVRVEFGLTLVDTSMVALLADEAICARAQSKISATRSFSEPVLPVHVLSVGPSRYAVTDSAMVSEDDFMVLTDTSFSTLIAIRF